MPSSRQFSRPLIAVVAHGLAGISPIWNGPLQKKGMQSLASYVFWPGAMSIIALVLIPFGFHMPSWHTIAIAVAAGLIDLVAVHFYYAALKAGEASRRSRAIATNSGSRKLSWRTSTTRRIARPSTDFGNSFRNAAEILRC